MANDMNRSIGDSGRMAAKGARTVGRAGARAARSAVRNSRRSAEALIPPQVKIGFAIVLIIILLIATAAGGLSSSQMDENFYYTAMDEEGKNRPETGEEAEDATWDLSRALAQTSELATIIHDAKRDERSRLEGQLAKSGESDATVICETDSMPIYINSDYPMTLAGAGYTSTTTTNSGGISKNNQDVINGACAWAEAIAKDDSFHYGACSIHGGSPRPRVNANKKMCSHRRGCYFCGTNAKSKSKYMIDHEKTYCCNTFVFSAFAHGGGEPVMYKMCKKGMNAKTAILTGSGSEGGKSGLFKSVGRPGKSSLQKGDILWYSAHWTLYIGNGKMAEAGTRDDNKKGSKSWNNSIRVTRVRGGYYKVTRYIGKGGGKMEIPAGSSLLGSDDIGSFSPKSSYTELGKITNKTGKRHSIGYIGASNCAQSFAYVGNYFAVCFVDTDHPPGYVQLYDTDGKKHGKVRKDSIYHANGACSTREGTLLVAGSLKSGKENVGTEFNISGTNISHKGSRTLPTAASSIAYDRDTRCYALRVGSNINIFDENFNKKNTIKATMHGTYYQDIGAGGGYIFACHTKTKGKENYGSNFVDIYMESTGEYCGSYNIDYGELESAEVVNGELVLLVHIVGYGNYIQFTGISVQGGSSGITNGITKSDLDILAAYSVTLSNTGLYKKEEGEEKEEDSLLGLFSTEKYTDINGKKIKTYRIGEKRGRINYPGDLKSRIRDPLKSFKIGQDSNRSSATESVQAIDTSKWSLLLVNANNKIPDGYSPALTTIESKYITTDSTDKWRNRVDERIYEELKKMLDDCAADPDIDNSHTPLICSAYRTYDMQKELYDSTANKNDTAIPGTSEHECGLAVDIVDSSYRNLDDAQANTKAQQWLMEHCQEYGFILRYPKDKQDVTGIIWEPWHYRYVGKTDAKAIMSAGICLEEYLNQPSPVSNSTQTSYVEGTGGLFYKVLSGKKAITAMKEDGIDTAVAENTGTKIYYLQERPVSYICRHLFLIDPDAKYSGASNLNHAQSNLAATYAISDNTEHILYTGTIDPSLLGSTGGIYGSGSLKLPLPPGSFTVTSHIGKRVSPGGIGSTDHKGVDLAAPTGTKIYASLAGYVKKARYYGGYGNCVIIQSGNTEIYYGHMSKILVKENTYVTLGQNIGLVGSTGNSTGPHLHFEVHQNGKVVDPEPMLGLR